MADLDLTQILRDWPYESGQLHVRLIRAGDGRLVVQTRVELGILQMELTGRPDGTRPGGQESWLALVAARLEAHRQRQGTDEGFAISMEDCRRLREEALQYYHRYTALLALDEYDAVARDASHNLGIIRLVRRYAESEFDRESMNQIWTHTILTRTRAEASQAVEMKQPQAALRVIDAGLAEIREALDALGAPPEAYEDSQEVRLLRGMRDALIPKLPVSQRMELMRRLQEAIAAENYELAAILRDELRLLEG